MIASVLTYHASFICELAHPFRQDLVDVPVFLKEAGFFLLPQVITTEYIERIMDMNPGPRHAAQGSLLGGFALVPHFIAIKQ